MGIRGSKMTFLRPPYHVDSDQNCRVFEASIPWGKGQARTAGKQSERDRVRDRYPSFQKRDAHALRFGSMNPISRLLVHGVFVASLLWGFGRVVEITIGRRAKVIIPGGYPGGIRGGLLQKWNLDP